MSSLSLLSLLTDLAKTHPAARVVPNWVPGHLRVERNKQADKLAKEAVHDVGGHLEALEKRRRREKQVQRGKRAPFYCPVLADGCTSDSSTEEEEEEEGKAGLG